MIKALLEGKPFAHPLHPTLVHLPIGLFVLSLLFDLATLLTNAGNELVRGAFYTMVFGIVAALLAAIPGFVDRADIRADHPAWKTATTHMWLNLAAVVLYLINALLRYGALDQNATPTLPLILSLAGVGLLSFSGYLGGTMVYNDGIAVGRHRRYGHTPEQTIRVTAGAPGQFAPVALTSSLANDETLRAEVNGHVMTIAKVDNEFYAFQDFCTHRFGPLSEGDFHNHEVMCPWHRSCFDVRTGKVTQGPAKVDLKTYDVTIENGQICVRVPTTAG